MQQTSAYSGNRFGIDMINPSLCTHLVYGAAVLDRQNSNIKLMNEGPGQGKSTDNHYYLCIKLSINMAFGVCLHGDKIIYLVLSGSLIPIEELVILKTQKGRNPDLKIFISVSGNSEDWSTIAKLSRHAFANNVRNFLK